MQITSTFRSLRCLIACLCLSLPFATASFAAPSESFIIVAPGTESQPIDLGSQTVVGSYEEPLHGTLVATSYGFDYYPEPSFWAAGHDVVILETVKGLSSVSGTLRIVLTAGALSFEHNAVYSTEQLTPNIFVQPWTFHSPTGNEIEEVPGVLAGTAYRLSVLNGLGDQPRLSVQHPNSAGHQQTAEYNVDVSVDDIDGPYFPLSTDELSFFKVTQNQQILVELRAHFSHLEQVWKIRPSSPLSPTPFPPVTVNEGFHRVKLVRWGTIGASGADFYINGQNLGTLHGLPLMGLGPELHELTLTETDEHAGLKMRFESPIIVAGQNLVDPAKRQIYESFPSGAVSHAWSQVDGQSFMGFSKQALSGDGYQIDMDLGSVPHWQHIYLRQDYLSDPLRDFKARFWMDPSLLNLPEGNSVRLVYGCTNSAANYCVDFRLLLSRVNGELKLALHTWDDAGGTQVISSTITQDAHFIEFHYHTADAPGIPTGWAKLWIDGNAVGVSEGLNNANKKVEDVRFGSNYTASTVTGILSFDELETWTY